MVDGDHESTSASPNPLDPLSPESGCRAIDQCIASSWNPFILMACWLGNTCTAYPAEHTILKTLLPTIHSPHNTYDYCKRWNLSIKYRSVEAWKIVHTIPSRSIARGRKKRGGTRADTSERRPPDSQRPQIHTLIHTFTRITIYNRYHNA